MKQETRTKNSVRNIAFSMIAYMVQILLGFLARRYFIYYFNEEYLGLNSLFSNVLSILSLAELGFGTAIVFSMYKPMADGDDEKVRQLLWYYKKCYAIIGTVVLCAGLCVLPFMNYFQSKAPNVDVNLYIVYLIFLFNSVISYFFAHRRSLLYTSQRNDIESKINAIFNIVLTSCQMIAICVLKNYYLYIILIGVNNVVCNLVVYAITNKKYAEFVKKPESYLDKESIKKINKDIRSLIFHKIGSVVVFSTDSLIIYLMLGSADLGKYSNYLLITSSVSTLIALFCNSLRGSIGNSIAVESIEKNKQLMNNLNFVYFWIISFCVICIFSLADSFIDIILTKQQNVSLLFDKTVLICVCVSFYLSQSRYLTGMFKECAGLFYQDRYKALIESVVNLAASIVLVKFIGIAGVVLGTIISTVTTCLWIEPYVLFKNYYKQKLGKYWSKYTFYTAVMLIVGIVTYFVCSLVPDVNLWTLVAKFAICAVVPNVLFLVCYFWTPEFKYFVGLAKGVLYKFKNRHKNTLQPVLEDIETNSETQKNYLHADSSVEDVNVDMKK